MPHKSVKFTDDLLKYSLWTLISGLRGFEYPDMSDCRAAARAVNINTRPRRAKPGITTPSLRHPDVRRCRREHRNSCTLAATTAEQRTVAVRTQLSRLVVVSQRQVHTRDDQALTRCVSLTPRSSKKIGNTLWLSRVLPLPVVSQYRGALDAFQPGDSRLLRGNRRPKATRYLMMGTVRQTPRALSATPPVSYKLVRNMISQQIL